MEMFYKVKMQEGFKDGNVQNGYLFRPGETYTISESDRAKILQGGGRLEDVERMVKNPLKDLPAAEIEPADPRNAENEINDVENHVPGTEDEQEEVRARDEARKEKRIAALKKAREAKAAKKARED